MGQNVNYKTLLVLLISNQHNFYFQFLCYSLIASRPHGCTLGGMGCKMSEVGGKAGPLKIKRNPRKHEKLLFHNIKNKEL